MRFWEETARPASVFGPVEAWELARLAASWASEMGATGLGGCGMTTGSGVAAGGGVGCGCGVGKPAFWASLRSLCAAARRCLRFMMVKSSLRKLGEPAGGFSKAQNSWRREGAGTGGGFWVGKKLVSGWEDWIKNIFPFVAGLVTEKMTRVTI